MWQRPENPNPLAPFQYEQGLDAMHTEAVNWLDEPCTEHPLPQPEAANQGIVARLRRGCPKCWQQFKEGK